MPLDIPLGTEAEGYTVVIDGRIYRPFKVDSSGRPLVLLHGWDGAAWQKLPLLWGYSDRYKERIEELTHAAGDRSLVSSTVPTGEVWVLERLLAINYDTAISHKRLYHHDAALDVMIGQVQSPVAGSTFEVAGPITLKAGDCITCEFGGTALNQPIRLYLVGYKMKVA